MRVRAGLPNAAPACGLLALGPNRAFHNGKLFVPQCSAVQKLWAVGIARAQNTASEREIVVSWWGYGLI